MACKMCGAEEGYYLFTPVSGRIATFYTESGEYDTSGNNTDMYSGITYGEEGKKKYCAKCHGYYGWTHK